MLDGFTGAGLTVLTEGPGPSCALDAEDGCPPHLRERGHTAVSVRPDAYLFGAAGGSAEPHERVGRLREQLHGTGAPAVAPARAVPPLPVGAGGR